MAKEKVFIVLSHIHRLKKGSKTEWETQETVEFVNTLRNKHATMATATADYLNRKVISGTRFGIKDYDEFEGYIRKKYPKQMAQLDAVYRPVDTNPEITDAGDALFVDQHGNLRAKTVFDV